jgi:ATP-dependent RNA helicase HelY
MNERPSEIPPPKLITALRSYNLLPAIVFLPTRRKCDEAASDVAADRSQKTDPDRQRLRQEIYDRYAEENPEVRRHKHRKILVSAGIAAHHAGHIPAWKLLIEKMMSAGLLNAIFATSTVAAGVDFPARTVVITNADTRGNDGWRSLQASELQQMTGRAGRRGKDNVGFAVLAPGQFQNPKKIAELLKAPPDPLQSKFRATYTSLLNLLDAFGSFDMVREIAEKSFAFRDTARQIDKLEKERGKRLRQIEMQLTDSGFGFSTDDLRGFERLLSARNRLHERLPGTRIELRHSWLKENVTKGRVVTQGKSSRRLYIVLNAHGENISAMRDDGQGASFALGRINRVYEKKYGLHDAAIEEAFLGVYDGKNPPIEEPKISHKDTDTDAAEAVLNAAIENLVPGDLSDEKKQPALEFLWMTWKDAEFLHETARDVSVLKDDIWLPFEKKARVLDHFGYLDFAREVVTESGEWLADLRVDRPLLVGEALRQGIFNEIDYKQMAGVMASVASDADRNYGDLYLSDELLDALNQFEQVIYDVAGIEWKNGVEPVEEINYSAAAAAERWAGGTGWDELVSRTKAEEGDLVRLLSRTGEALFQIAHLEDSNPKAAEIARQTAEIILREPVRQ